MDPQEPSKYNHAIEFGKKAVGRAYLIALLDGKDLPNKKRMQAMCYECMGGYNAGLTSCQMISCPLYKHMPYRDKY